MAKAYQCDRCNKYYMKNKKIMIPGNPTSIRATEVTIYASTKYVKSYELCDECLTELINWLGFRTVTKE